MNEVKSTANEKLISEPEVKLTQLTEPAQPVVRVKESLDAQDIVLDCCLALKQKRLEEAQASFSKLLALPMDEALLEALATCLVTAARRSEVEVFVAWLNIISLQKLPLSQDFLCKLCFVGCDKRLGAAFPALRSLVKGFLRTSAVAEAKQVEKLISELVSLAARMARRGWRAEARWALRLVAWSVLRSQDLRKWQGVFLQLALHFVVEARWDGFVKACGAFPELLYLELAALRRAGRSSLDETTQGAYLQLVLRTWRDIVANVSRTAMQDDMDIFRQWYQYLWQLAGDNARRKRELFVLLQLNICYWQGTRPKTSRKQVQFLKDLLHPSLLNEHYAGLLKKII